MRRDFRVSVSGVVCGFVNLFHDGAIMEARDERRDLVIYTVNCGKGKY